MATRVYVDGANPAVDRPIYKQSVVRAQQIVDRLEGRFFTLPDGRRAVMLYPSREVAQERSARNAVLVIARVLDPRQHPPRLHYPVPAVVDHRLRWHNRFLIQNSADERLLPQNR
jgi:hypothetical protein